MASNSPPKGEEKEVMYPAVPMYGPHTIRGIQKGETKLWCTCGLSKKQPWCDGSHKDTGMKPLKWTAENQQSLMQICGCKYTKAPPFCDGTHTNLPCDVLDRQKHCKGKDNHTPDRKLCTGCGWIPDF